MTDTAAPVALKPPFVPPAGYGVIPLEEMAKVSGLDLLQGMLDGRFPAPPIAERLPYWIREVGEGWAVFEGDCDATIVNPTGMVHGGFALTILDSVLASAVQTKLPAGRACASLEVKVNFVRPMTPATGRVRAHASALHVGRTTGLAEGKLTDANGKLLAYGSATIAVFAAPE